MTEPVKTYEIDGKAWELWYRRGDIATLRRRVFDRDKFIHEETHAVNLWAESQKRFPNEQLLLAAHLLPDDAEHEDGE